MYTFPNFEAVRCSMSNSNFHFLACIQNSQEADKVVWYSHISKNFPQFVVIHTVKGFIKSIVPVLEKMGAFLVVQWLRLHAPSAHI